MTFDRLENMDEVSGFEKAMFLIATKGLVEALEFKNNEINRLDNEVLEGFIKMIEDHENNCKGLEF